MRVRELPFCIHLSVESVFALRVLFEYLEPTPFPPFPLLHRHLLGIRGGHREPLIYRHSEHSVEQALHHLGDDDGDDYGDDDDDDDEGSMRFWIETRWHMDWIVHEKRERTVLSTLKSV